MMAHREQMIARSVASAIQHCSGPQSSANDDKASAFFNAYWSRFSCVREDLFRALRQDWNITDDQYKRESFGHEDALQPMGDMGYSGSTFFKTHDSIFLVKSVPRSFEHSFFKNDMLMPYVEYMQINPNSLLVRIMDFLECSHTSVGSMLHLSPSHHLVMENILYGESSNSDDSKKWESWDLKPMSYFYPERDVAGGVLSSEATKSKLADDFTETLVLTLDDAEAFKGQLEKDTALLRKCNAVDYSLFLVRIPTDSGSDASPTSTGRHLWRVGMPSSDGKYIYRASILDFFWAKHKVHAKAMTGLIKTYNIFDRQGPMSVTTTAEDYRERFLHMCKEIIEIKDRQS